MDTSIFKAYDIRGIYPSQLDEAVAYNIARAFAKLLHDENSGKKLKLGVGQDMRLSSPSLSKHIIQGLLNSGMDVVDFGLVSTPTFYYAIGAKKLDGGIQISASHNPGEYNGLKMVRASAVPVSGNTGIAKLPEMIESEQYVTDVEPGKLETYENILDELVKSQVEFAKFQKPKDFKIAIDGANAMGILDYQKFFDAYPNLHIEKINFTLDGTFPGHEADPMKEENVVQLKKLIKEKGCDFGIAPDGDADRLFILDETGEVVPQSIFRGLLAKMALEKNPGSLVAYDIRPGKATKDIIDEAGGKAIVTSVGHSLIKEQLIKTAGIFGGESSGHFFYKTPEGTFEAPLIALCELISLLEKENKPLSEIIAPYNRYKNSGEVNTKVKSREEVLEKIAQIKMRYSDGALNEIDGVFIEYPDVWFSVRASNTEPLIRLIVEANTQEKMESMREELLTLIRN